MAVIDWPSSRAFYPATFQVGADVPQSAWRGFYTGTRETYMHAADRLVGLLALPPCRGSDAADREAFIGALLSSGDLVRMPMWHRRYPRGNAHGSITVNGAVAAGARTLSLQGALAFPNRILFPSEIDNASWNKTTGVTVTANYASSPSGLPGAAERIQYNGTGTAGSFRVYENATADLVTPAVGQQVVLSVYLTAVSGTPTVRIGNNLGNFTTCALNATWQRFSVAGTGTGASALQLLLYSNTADNAAWDIAMYGAQAETGTVASAYAGVPTLKAGDWFSVGGNLLQVRADISATDSGAFTSLPLTYPVQKAISSGEAATLSSPTGVWQLDTQSLRFDYSASVLQEGIAIPLRQVVA